MTRRKSTSRSTKIASTTGQHRLLLLLLLAASAWSGLFLAAVAAASFLAFCLGLLFLASSLSSDGSLVLNVPRSVKVNSWSVVTVFVLIVLVLLKSAAEDCAG